MTQETSEPISTELLFARHAGFVARFLYRLGASAESMDDLVQEVFLAVHRHRPKLNTSQSRAVLAASFGIAGQSFQQERTARRPWQKLCFGRCSTSRRR